MQIFTVKRIVKKTRATKPKIKNSEVHNFVINRTSSISKNGKFRNCEKWYILLSMSDWAKIIVWQPLLSVVGITTKNWGMWTNWSCSESKAHDARLWSEIVLYVMAIWFRRPNRCARSWHDSPFLPSETIAWGDADSWGDLSTAWSCSTTIVRKLWIALKPANIIGAYSMTVNDTQTHTMYNTVCIHTILHVDLQTGK